jgi:hypothetical protein
MGWGRRALRFAAPGIDQVQPAIAKRLTLRVASAQPLVKAIAAMAASGSTIGWPARPGRQ